MRVLIIPDTHAPYAHPDALDFLSGLKRRYKPDTVVHIGDLGDQHGWSRHTASPQAKGGADEDTACLAWCKKLYKLFPVVKACIGNHDTRLAKAGERAGVPNRLLATIPQIYESPEGWEWGRQHVIDNVYYCHGDGVRGNDPAMQAVRLLGISCAIGHYHTLGGVSWLVTTQAERFALSVGCLCDPDAPAFGYAAASLRRSRYGAGVVLDGIPHFIPLEG